MDDTIDIISLSKDLANANADVLVELLDTIPKVTQSRAELLADNKGERVLSDKWELSLVARTEEELVGVLIAYRREPEPPHYQQQCVYVGGLAVSEGHRRRGIATTLLEELIERVDEQEQVALQTNSDDFNREVIRFYESFGFSTTGTKVYENRTDIIMSATRSA